jgi:hypothetical protein
MSLQAEIAAARDDVRGTRAQLSDTIAELEERVTAPLRTVKRSLDVGQMVKDHPWVALTVAVGAGVAVATTGVDAKVGALAVEKARQGGAATVRLTREAPSRTRDALASGVSALGAKLATMLIDVLREPRVAGPASEPHSGIGFVDNPAPAHEPTQAIS